MKKVNAKYILLAVVILTVYSCTKLDQKPYDVIDPDKAFRNINDINMGLIGTYALADYSQISLNSTVSDEAMYPTENTVGNSDAFRWLYTAANGSVTSLYGSYYSAIDRLNRVLAGLGALTFNGNDALLAERYKGELLGLRAFFHMELLRAYAAGYEADSLGIPYMKTSVIGYPARDKFATVIAEAKSDLAEAKKLIPASFTDKTRFTRLAVAALQARIALYEKNWSEAIGFATEVINAMPLATKTQFPGIWTDANDNEVIWKLKRVGTTDSRVGDFYFRQSGGIVLYAPSFKLINTFDKANDIRYTSYIQYDNSRTGTKSQYLVKKYIGGTATTPGLTDIKMFRTAEMYLIRAEAEAESSGDAAGDLNTLRAARINGYSNQTFDNKALLLEAIMTERYKELAFEGHRFYDLKRKKLPVERLPEDAVNASGAVKLLPEKAQYCFPLPAAEIQINKNTVQNPNY